MTGTTIASNGNQTDYCDATYPTWNLVEFFCNENDLLQSEGYLCSNGCDNGACIQFLFIIKYPMRSKIIPIKINIAYLPAVLSLLS